MFFQKWKEFWKTKHGRAEKINLVNDVKWMCGEEKEDGNRLELQLHFVHLTSTLRNSYDQWSHNFFGHFFASVYWVGLWIVPGYGQTFSDSSWSHDRSPHLNCQAIKIPSQYQMLSKWSCLQVLWLHTHICYMIMWYNFAKQTFLNQKSRSN